MISWKEKVAGKLSRFLADSPSSSRPHVARDSPLRDTPQAFPLSANEFSSCEKPSLSSYILSFLPAISSSVEHQKLTKDRNQEGFTSAQPQSLASRWKSKGFTWEDRPLEQSSDYEVLPNTCDEPTVISEDIWLHTPERNINGSHNNETFISHDLKSFHSDVVLQSTFVSLHLFEFLESSLPNIVKGCQWVLLYSTRKHGISLHTLIRKSADIPGPCLLIVGDMQGAVFGGLLDAPLKPTAKRKYQGTHQTFVFTTLYGDPRLFRPTGANRFYYLCLNELLAFGGGGSFALCLNEDLLSGTSGPSDTFGNMCLAHTPEFEVKNVELWGFTHPSLRFT